MEEAKRDPSALEQMRVDAYNETVGTLSDYDCPICKNKGYVACLKDRKMVLKICECMKRRISMQRLEKSGLVELLKTYTMDSYKTDRPWQKTAKKKALDFVDAGKGWFVISGTSGTGKTHLCTAICGMLLEKGYDVRYMIWREEAPKLKASVNDRDAYERAMNELKNCGVLYIDDFWKGNVTEADINLAFELLNARYNDRRKITIISGERSIEKILDIDQAVGSRIYELAKGNLIMTPDENYRLR